jgi:hypothetical protein
VICFAINFQLIPPTGLPSLCSGFPVGGENDKKGEAGSFNAQNLMAAPFSNVSFTAKSKQASFFCSRYILSLRSVLGMKKGAFSPFFRHSAES